MKHAHRIAHAHAHVCMYAPCEIAHVYRTVAHSHHNGTRSRSASTYTRCMRTHVHTCVWHPTCLNARMHVCASTHRHAHALSVLACITASRCACSPMLVCMHAHAHAHAHTYTPIHACMHPETNAARGYDVQYQSYTHVCSLRQRL